MKYVKMTLGILAVSALTCFASVFATSQGYNITLKALNLSTTLGPLTKTTTAGQSYKNIGTINSCTANYNSVAVRVYSEAEGYSNWMTVSHGSRSYWPENNKTTVPRAYNLEIKNGTTTPCTANHFGTWYLDIV